MKDKIIVTFNDMTTLVEELITQLDKDKWRPDIVVGISRGGLLAATMISHYYDCEFQALSWSSTDGASNESNCWLPEDALEGKKTLIVDNISSTGKTLKQIQADWNSAVFKDLDWDETIQYAVLHQRRTCEFPINYVAEHITDSDWIEYPNENWW